MPRDRANYLYILDMPWPVAVVATINAVVLVYSLLLALFVYRWEWVLPTGGPPNAWPFDIAAVNTGAYAGSRHPRRGDLVLVRREQPNSIAEVTRVLGEPGDLVTVRNGVLAIDRRPVWKRCRSLPPFAVSSDVSDILTAEFPPPDLLCDEYAWEQAKMYRTLDLAAYPASYDPIDEWLGKDEYFIALDDRSQGFHSRISYGVIVEREVVGRIDFVVPVGAEICRQVERRGEFNANYACLLRKVVRES